MYKQNYTQQPSGIYSGMQGGFNIWRLINVIHHINRLKKNYHIIIWTDAKEKAFDKTQYFFMIKALSKLWVEGNFFSLMKNIYKIPTATITQYT